MWELDFKESWASKNGCFWTVMLEKTFESPLDCMVFIGRTDVEPETPILSPPHAKSWLIWKDPDAGKDWGQEEKGTTEDEMASPTQWTWVWVSSRSWWWIGRPGMLQSMGSHRVGHDWATELNWIMFVIMILLLENSLVRIQWSIVYMGFAANVIRVYSFLCLLMISLKTWLVDWKW